MTTTFISALAVPSPRILRDENLAFPDQMAEERRAGNALGASEGRLRLVLQSVGDAIISCGSDGAVFFWNPAAEKIFGHCEDEALGRSFEIMMPERFRELYRAEVESLEVDAGTRRISGTVEFVGLAKGGREFPIDLALSAWRMGEEIFHTCVVRDITETKRSEEALRESEERFYGAFESAPIGVALVAPDGHWLKVNRAFCDLVGYSDAELLTRTFQEITHPADLKDNLENLRRLVASETRSYKMEKRYIHARGHFVTVWLSVALVRDNQGQPRYFIAQIQDITEQKRVDAELRWKTAFLEAQVNSSIDGILVVDGQGRKILQNRRFADLLGIPQRIAEDKDDEKQLQWITGITKNPDEFLERVLYLNSHQYEISWDEIELKNGKILDRYSSPVVGGDEKYYGRIWTFRDITARKRTEEALRESEEKFLQLADNITDVFWIASADLETLHYVSAGYELIWGRSRETLRADPRQWAEAILPEERERVSDIFSALRENEPEASAEYRIIHSDGTIRWVHDRGFQVRDASGRLVRLAGIATDITERKRAEAELESVHKQFLEASRLGGMAEIATNVLHNVGNVLNSVNVSAGMVAACVKRPQATRLERVVALLREHEGNLGEFVTNDPKGRNLTAYLAQLSKQFLDDQKTTIQELSSLQGNIEHIKEIVAMQQSYATASAVKEVINISELVEDSLRMNEGSLTNHQVEVIREFEKIPSTNLEKHKILQILVNLIRNAKQSCQESSRTDKKLKVRVASEEGHITISVIDNGLGILPENMTRIFSHGFTTRKDGHGFGLHSGALAAKEMGGSLTVHSDGAGQGATFTLELPFETNKPIHQ
jgi:PAS domain S-box-containing protein